MITEILTTIAGNLPTLIAIILVYYALRHLIRDEMNEAIRRLDDKTKTLNALRGIHR